MVRLEKESDDARAINKANEQRIEFLSTKLSTLKSTSSSLRQDLTGAEAKYEELTLRYNFLIRLRDRDLQQSATSARKEFKGNLKSSLSRLLVISKLWKPRRI